MNEKFKKQWVEALRSGKYKQSHLALRTDRGYCCLGVLCDVVDPNNWGDLVSGNYEYNLGAVEFTLLPPSMAIRTGLGSHAGFIDGLCDRDGNTLSLVLLNDTGFTFEQIADMIEYFF